MSRRTAFNRINDTAKSSGCLPLFTKAISGGSSTGLTQIARCIRSSKPNLTGHFRWMIYGEPLWKKEILPGPYEPIDGFTVVIINDNGVPIERIQTAQTPGEVWAKSLTQQDLNPMV